MLDLTRRTFLGASAAIPFSLWLQGCTPAGPRIRYDARSTEGQAMLRSYATAVTNMRTAVAEGDPTSWVFQWYTHGVRSDTTKADELDRIYPAPPPPIPDRSLAEDMWSTCQAHTPGDPEDFFLPWHRMYVYFFESIVRQASGDLSFTLPYWDYSAADPAVHGILPPEFRMPTSADFGSLYVDRRNAGANAGTAIDQGQPGNPLGLGALSECQYSSSGAMQGFNLRLDSGLHGNVHVLTGNSMNMGSVPWAAFDPIFWMHHCNIDRLWASWNEGGRANPTSTTWLDQTFVFATAGGTRVVSRIGDFSEIAPLGYEYDRLEPIPPCPTTTAPAPADAAAQTMFKVESVEIGASPTSVSMGDMAVAGDAAPQALRQRMEGLGDRRLYLVARGLSASLDPGVLYNLFLEVPTDMSLGDAEAHHVGSIHFFGASGHGGHGGPTDPDKFHSFDVTDLAKRLMADDLLSDSPTLTIAPSGTPADEATPVVAEISLVEQ